MSSRFSLSPGAIFVLSFVYFFGGLSSLAAVMLSAAVHEAGHAAAICALDGRIKRVSFDSSGLCMACSGVYSTAGEVLIFLSGPLAGLALAYACAKLGNAAANNFLLRTAGVSLAFTAYNLLPALPLDGGRALYCVLCVLVGKERCESKMYFISITVALVLSFLGICDHSTQVGIVLLASSVCLLLAQTGIVKSMRML